MNDTDLLNALSGIDPKYIDEAAFELHEESVSAKKKMNKRKMAKVLYFAVPMAAALLLIVGVAIPAILRVSKKDSSPMAEAPMAAAESSQPAEEPVAEAAPAVEAESADEETSDEAAYEAEEAVAEAAEETAKAEGAADAMMEEADHNAEVAVDEPPAAAAEAESTAEAAQDLSESELYSLKNRDDLSPTNVSAPIILGKAVCDGTVLTIDVTGNIPDDLDKKDYKIREAKDKPDKAPVAEGTLGKMLTKEAGKIRLDISDLKLEKGDYIIEIEGSRAEFTIK